MGKMDGAQVSSSLISCVVPFTEMGQNEDKNKRKQISSNSKEKLTGNLNIYMDLKILKIQKFIVSKQNGT